jgi:hypothetical protein
VKRALVKFETKCSAIKHCFYKICRCVSQGLHLFNVNGDMICKHCLDQKSNKYDQSTTLSIWTDDDGQIQYDQPFELSCLREGKKLLILMVSVYIQGLETHCVDPSHWWSNLTNDLRCILLEAYPFGSLCQRGWQHQNGWYSPFTSTHYSYMFSSAPVP